MTGRAKDASFRVMPRRLRVASGGYAYHVLNRAVGRMRIFGKERDFEAFEEVIAEARSRLPMGVLAWCVLPNHWHLALWPRRDGDLSEFMCWLTVTHTQRWHAAPHGRDRSAVSRAFQVVPDPGRRSSPDRAAVRGAKRCGPIWSNGPTPGGGRVFGTASAGTSPDCSTRVR